MMKSAARTISQSCQKQDLDDYAGKYKMTGLPFPYIEVSVKDGKLMMKAGEQGGRHHANE